MLSVMMHKKHGRCLLNWMEGLVPSSPIYTVGIGAGGGVGVLGVVVCKNLSSCLSRTRFFAKATFYVVAKSIVIARVNFNIRILNNLFIIL